jgi:hypothetical protein
MVYTLMDVFQAGLPPVAATASVRLPRQLCVPARGGIRAVDSAVYPPQHTKPPHYREIAASGDWDPLSDPGPDMTTTTHVSNTAAAHHPWLHFIRHFAEMVIAMGIGMLVLGAAVSALFGELDILQRPDVSALVMATNMTLGMSLWMAYRKHSWPSILEMARPCSCRSSCCWCRTGPDICRGTRS